LDVAHALQKDFGRLIVQFVERIDDRDLADAILIGFQRINQEPLERGNEFVRQLDQSRLRGDLGSLCDDVM
jgi:hypothetical protein